MENQYLEDRASLIENVTVGGRMREYRCREGQTPLAPRPRAFIRLPFTAARPTDLALGLPCLRAGVGSELCGSNFRFCAIGGS
jgi:hypothetical protein